MDPHEPDGVNEVVNGALRVSLTVAAQIAERVAREREEQARAAQAAGEQEARELQNRLGAERSAARAQLAPVERQEWWTNAGPADIAAAWETAQTWRDEDPAAKAAAERIHDELRDRYGIDTDELGADPAAVRDALAARDGALAGADRDRRAGDAEEAEAIALLGGADLADATHDLERGDDQRFDASDHITEHQGREELARSLEGVGDTEAIQARVLAATDQARPASDAAAEPHRGARRARRARSASPVRDRARGR